MAPHHPQPQVATHSIDYTGKKYLKWKVAKSASIYKSLLIDVVILRQVAFHNNQTFEILNTYVIIYFLTVYS